ncbi:hypothetical protein HDU86_006030 [Geranomyces michiganensis]|nr:hypothetical protein HDU86_006030 [Geranomyces michiganensis]
MSSSSTSSSVPILVNPSPPPVPAGYPRARYTPDQLQKLDAVREKLIANNPALAAAAATSTNNNPASPSPPAGDNLHDDAAWCDDACLLRYLRAVKWDTEAAVKRIESTLKWRHEYGPHRIDPAEVEPEAVNGKEFLTGFDLQGRPSLYLVPRKEHTKTYDRQLRYVVYNLERAIRAMPPGIESLNILIDYEGLSVFTAPPASQSKKVLQILGDHYPERLGKGFIFNPSWYLWAFFKIIGPFIDPITRSKIHFVNLKKLPAEAPAANSDEHDDSAAAPNTPEKAQKEAEGMGGWTDPRRFIAPEMLVAEYGGKHNFVYNHDVYWKAVNA